MERYGEPERSLFTTTKVFTLHHHIDITDGDGNIVYQSNSRFFSLRDKTDITDSTPLPGAVLEVRDSKGKRIERWTTTKKPHMIERLPVGKYTLTEITAPKGYEVAETISFEVKDTGEIQKVEMKDKPVRETKDEKGGKKPDEEKGGNGKETNEAKGENEDKKKETEKAAGGGSAVSPAAGTSEAPRTGDDTDPVGPAAALILSLLLILGILVFRKAKQEK